MDINEASGTGEGDSVPWQVGWGRGAILAGLLLNVEFTLGGCIYAVVDLRRSVPVIEARSTNLEHGKLAAVSIALNHTFGADHGEDPVTIARSICWAAYSF